jgi:transcriptional regulator with XRE-family HTH domain
MGCRENVLKGIIWLIDAREGGNRMSFARRVGVTPQNAYNWVHGFSSPDLERVGNIAAIYDVSLDWLIGGDSAKAPTDYYYIDGM